MALNIQFDLFSLEHGVVVEGRTKIGNRIIRSQTHLGEELKNIPGGMDSAIEHAMQVLKDELRRRSSGERMSQWAWQGIYRAPSIMESIYIAAGNPGNFSEKPGEQVNWKEQGF